MKVNELNQNKQFDMDNVFGEVSNLKVNPFEIYLLNKNENIRKDYRFAVGSKVLSQSILNELEC
ncbi:TPA: hypothetical protein PQC92_002322 [Staphylococcus aureus]|uniref:Phage protein n=2 Tax=Staphylococcus TaxID=1279 RepID=A0A380FZY4_9STAP|nr:MULTISPECIES: hypothetical protein [Staphylococcus]EHS77451.1 hypothetical protein IS189_2779 [Staphylococcus aureus subsp. aureus IS-189]AGY90214.1 Hypothetical protein SAZ172_2114 [Staphylococcus aureus subsp. aureus Z172]AID40648.1 hypothetical protein SAXN108_2207 [Staphylococcus aureus]AND36778.1 hypothetical protein ASL17_11810 [Staphylococcus aureus]AND45441.1 hypothetical protein ASL18_11800 [Staphylococcus aureus]